MNYLWDGGRVILRHKGYAFRAFGHVVPLPLTFLLGRGDAEEVPVSDDTFSMRATITHPWWGKFYECRGQFNVVPAS
jgi:hypothetical protein